MLIDQLFSHPGYYFTVVGIVIGSVVLHELGHALTATWQGDPTPRMRGQLTWNPIAYMGWLGVGLAAVVGIAFGRTNVNRSYFRNRRFGDVMVSFAGPGVNLGLAVLASVVLGVAVGAGAPAWVETFWKVMLRYNIALFVFNLIPVPPFDGFSVADGLFRMGELGRFLRRAQPWPMIIAFLLVSQGPFWAMVTDAANVLLVPWGFQLDDVSGAG